METTLEKLNKAVANQADRKALARGSLAFFTYIYLHHYATYETPDFHKEIFKDLEGLEISEEKLLELLAFRGSAKSTIASLALPLWHAVTGRTEFIVPVSDSSQQSKLNIANIIHELENNELLIKDFGPFKSSEEWTSTNIVLAIGTRILSRSRGQKIRGLRHLQHRIGLLICDDLENNESVRTKEQRDKTWEWFISEAKPAVEPETGKIILIGSMLHSDGVMARQKKIIQDTGIGILREYPLVNDKGEIAWPQRFTKKDIDILRAENERFFQREYLLKLVANEGQVIKKVFYYAELPKIKALSIGVDLAISEKETADYTSINVIAKGVDNNFYNLRNIAGRWNFNTTLEKIHDTYMTYREANKGIPLFLGIEDVAYQRSAIQEYHRRYLIKPNGIKRSKDKRARLESIEPYFVSEQVLFRESGDEDVINEILNFGIEQHDDRMDAFEISLTQLLNTIQPNIKLL